MKKYIFTFIFVYLITNCLLFPRIAVEAAGEGIYLWSHQILPSLLPFTILSAIFLRSNWMDEISGKSSLFPICMVLCMGTFFGFPIGAKLSCDFYAKGYIHKDQAQILCICTNNFSPMYVNGYVIPLLFGINTIMFPMLFMIYAIPILIGILFLLYTGKIKETHKKTASRFQLDMQIIDAGIISGFETLIKICGYIVLFSIISAFGMHLFRNPSPFVLFILGNLEISGGIKLLSQHPLEDSFKYILAIQFLSFGGISGLAQTASFLKNGNLPVKNYIIGKTALTILLFVCAYIYYRYINGF